MAFSLFLPSGAPFLPSLRPATRSDAAEVEHIVVIAGPSGSGKSTLMREFVEGRLPRTISDELPQAAKAWQRTSVGVLASKGLEGVLASGRTPGLVVHYDIMCVLRRGYDDYVREPAIEAVTNARAALTVVTVLPPRQILFDQFIKRVRNGEDEDWWEKRYLIKPIKRKLRLAFHQLIGKSPKLLKEGQLVLLGVYGSDNGLKDWTTRWEEYLETVRRDRNDVRLVYVAPEPLQEGHPRFRLLRSI
jgi:ABC-type cobalamin/Fe3+-siderophores transport system ATPase subunit